MTVTESRFEPGTVLAGRYRIVDLIGRGGIGEVYRAEDLVLDLPVALKLLPEHLEQRPGRLDQLLKEVKVARRIAHPQVCRVHDVANAEGLHFLSMELVEGEDMASFLRRNRRLPHPRSIAIGHQICLGLAAAHSEGILHRDLKPANILIDQEDRIRITDFGLAALADGGEESPGRSGTPAYMAPEQHRGEGCSVRTDIYGLGLVLYELFCGQRAFEAEHRVELAWRHCSIRPVPPSSLAPEIEPAIERVILGCLEKEPQERPGSALEVAETLIGWRPEPGLTLPQRPNWRIERKLGEGGFGEVWLAVHIKTDEHRVFKFCFDPERLRALQREITLFRLLKEELGHRDDIARILDWDLEHPPFYIESAYTAGGNLAEWAAAQGGAENLPLATRLEIVAQTATALAAAHSVGVLHKDVKPANVLIREIDGEPRALLTDFGVGQLTDRRRLQWAGITAAGWTGGESGDSADEGTRLYQSPEILEGKPATLQADVYALGVMLYQLVVGDLSRALAPGWEQEIDDELLREDIAAAVDGSPERRLGDALRLAERLRGLEQRRRERRAEEEASREAERLEAWVARLRRRRRMTGLAMAVVLAVSAVVGVLAWRIAREAERADREARSAERVADFLVELFEVSDPWALDENAGDRSETVTARELLDRGSSKLAESLGDEPEIRARLLHTIGDIYQKLGTYEAAEEQLNEALELRRRLLGEKHPQVLKTLSGLGDLRRSQGRYEEAEELHRQVLAQRREAFGDRHVDVADSLNEVATVLEDQGEYADAETLYRESLELRRELFGDGHVSVADSLNNLALLLATWKRDLEVAEPLYREALGIFRQQLGGEHLTVAAVLNNLGMLHDAHGDFAVAEELYRESLRIGRSTLGEDHPEIATRLNNLAAVLEMQGKYAAAEPLYEEALDMRRRFLGDEHPLVSLTLNNLGFLYRSRGEYSKAEKVYREALRTRRQQLGEDHPWTLTSLRNLAEALCLGGDDSGADHFYGEAARMSRHRYGEEHAQFARSLDAFGECHLRRGDLEGAEPLIVKGMAIRRRVLGEEHVHFARSLEHLGQLLVARGEFAKAEDPIRRSLAIRRAAWPEDHWRLALTKTVLGSCLAGLGQDVEAETLLVESFALILEKKGPGFDYTRLALKHVVAFYESRGEIEKAAEYRRSLAPTAPPEGPGLDPGL